MSSEIALHARKIGFVKRHRLRIHGMKCVQIEREWPARWLEFTVERYVDQGGESSQNFVNFAKLNACTRANCM